MLDSIENLSGRHLTKEQIAYVIEERCKMFGLNIISVENIDRIKFSDVRFNCTTCAKENVRSSATLLNYKVTECKSCTDKRKHGRFKRKKMNKNILQLRINEKYKERNFSFTVVEDFTYINNKQVVKIVCQSCNAEAVSRIDLLTQGRKSCKCSKLRSVLETKVTKILQKYHLSFKTEFWYDDLRMDLPLRFDFCVTKDNKDYLIECDGIQHFYPTFGEEPFKSTVKSDALKNEYCLTNNIPILRIPYDTKESIEDLIKDFINL